jgi:hypothetical protein
MAPFTPACQTQGVHAIEPFDKDTRSKWTETEEKVLHQKYEQASKEKIMALLPGRSWMSIRNKAYALKLVRKNTQRSRRYTPQEDELIKRFVTGKLSKQEIVERLDRELDSIRARVYSMGLTMPITNPLEWEWVDSGVVSERKDSSRQSVPAHRS